MSDVQPDSSGEGQPLGSHPPNSSTGPHESDVDAGLPFAPFHSFAEKRPESELAHQMHTPLEHAEKPHGGMPVFLRREIVIACFHYVQYMSLYTIHRLNYMHLACYMIDMVVIFRARR